MIVEHFSWYPGWAPLEHRLKSKPKEIYFNTAISMTFTFSNTRGYFKTEAPASGAQPRCNSNMHLVDYVNFDWATVIYEG